MRRLKVKNHRRGATHPMAKLTTKKVKAIKKSVRAGAVLARLSEKYGVSISAIYRIKTGKNWAHVA